MNSDGYADTNLAQQPLLKLQGTRADTSLLDTSISFKTAPLNIAESVSSDETILSPTQSIRERLEQQEQHMLSPLAAKSVLSKGRQRHETPCPLRTAFQRDRDRLLHAKAFRRLKHKTQVFISPIGDHYRTRLTHTLEVAQVSRTIARALQLNEDLTEAIALGHDLGHPPFGHVGESVLNQLFHEGFHHEAHSVRIVTFLEPLNLSAEVLDGLQAQQGEQRPRTLEGQIVKLADRMTYLHHDAEDAVRAGLMQEKQLSREILRVLGNNRHERLETMVMDIVSASREQHYRVLQHHEALPTILMSDEVYQAMAALRAWMFRHVYRLPIQQQQDAKVYRVLSGLYQYLCDHPEQISLNIALEPDHPYATERRVVDYLAGMTDRFALSLYQKLLLPHSAPQEERDL